MTALRAPVSLAQRLFTYKALHNSAWDFICDLIRAYTVSRSLRSCEKVVYPTLILIVNQKVIELSL